MHRIHQTHSTPGRQLPGRRHRLPRQYRHSSVRTSLDHVPVPQWALDFNYAIEAAYTLGDDAHVNRLLREKYRRVCLLQQRLTA